MTTPRDDIAGKETHTIYDPFLKKDVDVSSKLTDRLRGKYAIGPIMPNGEPEFGWRHFETSPIQHEAATALDALQARVKELEAERDVLESSHRTVGKHLADEGERRIRAEQERDEAWKPMLPRGEVYSKQFTERGWKSFSDLHGEER